ncbi:unnamed protein product [Phytophthora lilii]|uniref:Unnamed protein product n=1 Tax=Phytophthora lilii TaxID=2077276 RepID=A0A9W6XSB9_9STRA|nr:unnamed protein product [Phytophthora lilii]
MYVGAKLRARNTDNQQCMTSIREDEAISPERVGPEWTQPDFPDGDIPAEKELGPGQRYGWWENHDQGDSHELATVHGAVNDERTTILLHTGASGSMISLELARRLKLKLRVLPEPIKVAGLGGVPTYITARTKVPGVNYNSYGKKTDRRRQTTP